MDGGAKPFWAVLILCMGAGLALAGHPVFGAFIIIVGLITLEQAW